MLVCNTLAQTRALFENQAFCSRYAKLVLDVEDLGALYGCGRCRTIWRCTTCESWNTSGIELIGPHETAPIRKHSRHPVRPECMVKPWFSYGSSLVV